MKKLKNLLAVTKNLLKILLLKRVTKRLQPFIDKLNKIEAILSKDILERVDVKEKTTTH